MTLADAIQLGKERLSSDTAKLDAELLLAHCLERTTSYLLTWPEKTLTREQQQQFETLLLKRQQGHPIAHLLGHREFWGLDFKINPHTLIPRPDTEILVEVALNKSENHQAWCFCDLGTGSGAIICAIKHERPDCHAVAVDYQADALIVAKANAKQHQLDIEFHQGSWFEPLEGQLFDCIVSNPPYIEKDDPHLTQGDVRFESITALTSGADGLNDIRTITKQAPEHLNHQGWLLLEHGYNQAEAVAEIMTQAGLQNIELHYDYGQNPRVTAGQWLDSNR